MRMLLVEAIVIKYCCALLASQEIDLLPTNKQFILTLQ